MYTIKDDDHQSILLSYDDMRSLLPVLCYGQKKNYLILLSWKKFVRFGEEEIASMLCIFLFYLVAVTRLGLETHSLNPKTPF